MLSEKQIEAIASNILISDVLDYVEKNAKDYQKFVKEKRDFQYSQNDEELLLLESVLDTGIIEIPISQ